MPKLSLESQKPRSLGVLMKFCQRFMEIEKVGNLSVGESLSGSLILFLGGPILILGQVRVTKIVKLWAFPSIISCILLESIFMGGI
jgi:hypothetical protein